MNGVYHTCDFSLLWHEGDEEVNRTEERIHSIGGSNWLICGLSKQKNSFMELAVTTNITHIVKYTLHTTVTAMLYSSTHHHMEGALRDVLPPKADGNNIFPRFRGCVVDVKGPIMILHHIHVPLHPLWSQHLTSHLAFSSSFGIHSDDCILGGLQLLKARC